MILFKNSTSNKVLSYYTCYRNIPELFSVALHDFYPELLKYCLAAVGTRSRFQLPDLGLSAFLRKQG